MLQRIRLSRQRVECPPPILFWGGGTSACFQSGQHPGYLQGPFPSGVSPIAGCRFGDNPKNHRTNRDPSRDKLDATPRRPVGIDPVLGRLARAAQWHQGRWRLPLGRHHSGITTTTG